MQTVLQYRERKKPEQRAPKRTTSAEDGGAAQDHRRDRVQLIPRARIRLGLTQVRDVDKSRGARYQTRECVNQSDSLGNGNACVPCAGRGESDGIEGSAEYG